MRITPIYMGSTVIKAGIHTEVQDHPHIHGEHKMFSAVSLSNVGSPPYTWGARGAILLAGGYLRITPIYMGSTRIEKSVDKLVRDHPHIHGEHTSIG